MSCNIATNTLKSEMQIWGHLNLECTCYLHGLNLDPREDALKSSTSVFTSLRERNYTILWITLHRQSYISLKYNSMLSVCI